MKTLKIVFVILISFACFSCKNTDFSNPEEVLKDYRSFLNENKTERLYEEFLSVKSKQYVTKDEFVRKRTKTDSTIDRSTHFDLKIFSLPIDINSSSYRRFLVTEKYLSERDTLNVNPNYTLINENGKWKVIWTSTLEALATQKLKAGQYLEARKDIQNILEMDPFNSGLYTLLAWCYLRDENISIEEVEEGTVKNAKLALLYGPENYMNYNILASYYAKFKTTDLAIQTYERGLQFCINKKEQWLFYSNLAVEYGSINNYDKAEENILKAIKADSNLASGWKVYGDILSRKGNCEKAIYYYKKALEKETKNMETYILADIYYNYALCSGKTGDCLNANKFVIKALDINPRNAEFHKLYNIIKNCQSNL